MKRCHYVTKALFLGLIISHCIATLQVYLSNKALYQTLTMISSAGYLVIPNQRTMPELLSFISALLGGLFFTLTVGAGLSLLAIVAARIWVRLLRWKRILLMAFLCLWLGLVVIVNWHGLSFLSTLYFLFIPPLVFLFTCKMIARQTEQGSLFRSIVYIAPVPLLALLWSFQMDGQFFVNLRDRLLLSNAIGTGINDFYYKYTLYPAEVFKSLDQKTLRTCYLGNIQKKHVVNALEWHLLPLDYLSLPEAPGIDLTIKEENDNISLEHQRKTIVQTSLQKFLAGPAGFLKEFSEKTDRFRFFRYITFLSLLVGFPITLYVFIHALFSALASFFFDSKASALIASALTFSLGVALFLVLFLGKNENISDQNLGSALQSSKWQTRLSALKVFERKNLDIGDFEAYKAMLKSPHVPERYWLARALGASRRPETYSHLVGLLEDSSPNVVYMALYGLGLKGDSRAISDIPRWLERSDHWYSQWYAYRALKALGWKQSKSR